MANDLLIGVVSYLSSCEIIQITVFLSIQHFWLTEWISITIIDYLRHVCSPQFRTWYLRWDGFGRWDSYKARSFFTSSTGGLIVWPDTPTAFLQVPAQIVRQGMFTKHFIFVSFASPILISLAKCVIIGCNPDCVIISSYPNSVSFIYSRLVIRFSRSSCVINSIVKSFSLIGVGLSVIRSRQVSIITLYC